MVKTPKAFWDAQREGYKYLATLPDLNTRLRRVPGPVAPIVDRLRTEGTRFVVSEPQFDKVDATQDRVGLTARDELLPPIVWINIARHANMPAQLAESELTDTLIHEGAHATGHYLSRLATSPDSPMPDQEDEEAVVHAIAAIIWRKIGRLDLAQHNEQLSVLHANRGRHSRKRDRAKDIRDAISWLMP